MQALRVARPAQRLALRRLTTAAPAASTSASANAPSLIPLSNVEAQWERMSKTEQATVQRQLEEIQKKDWKSLSVDEKKAGMSTCLSVSVSVSFPCLFLVMVDGAHSHCSFFFLSFFLRGALVRTAPARMHGRNDSLLRRVRPIRSSDPRQSTRSRPQSLSLHDGSRRRRRLDRVGRSFAG